MRKIMAVILTFCMLMSCTLTGMAFTALENDENIVRIGVMADAHVFDDSKAANDAITAFETLDANLDGIVLGGDMVANVPETIKPELYTAMLNDAKLTAWLSKKAPATTEARTLNGEAFDVKSSVGEGGIVWVMGNHEFPTNANDEAMRAAAWGKFQDETGLGIRGNVEMGGYHFIYSAAGGYGGVYTAEEQQWMMNEIEALLDDESYSNKPVFLVLHHPIPDSYYGTIGNVYGWSSFVQGVYTEEFVNFVKSQPRIIEFSAHTHYPAQEPRTIRQPEVGGFTSVQMPMAGNGYFNLDKKADLNNSATHEDSYGQALMLEIDKTTNVVTIKRLNIATGEFIGNDWTVDVAALQNGSGYNYTDSRYEDGAAPVFSSGDVTASNVTSSTATVSFPAATKFSAETETSYANIYDVKILNKKTKVVEFSKTMCSDYYKLRTADTFSMNVDNLDADTTYIAKITAISPYGVKSAEKSGEFTTKSVPVSGETILSSITIDSKNVKEASIGISGDGSYYGGWVGGGSRTKIVGEITPEFTGVYDVSVLSAFTYEAPDMTVFVDGIEVNTIKTSISEELTSPQTYEVGSIGLVAGKTYTVEMRCSKATGGYGNYWYNIKLDCKREIGIGDKVAAGDSVAPGVDDQGETPKVTLVDLSSVGTAANGDQRWTNWISGQGYAVKWNFTPEFTGMYKISADVKLGDNGTKAGSVGFFIDSVQVGDWKPATSGSTSIETLSSDSAFMMAGKTYEIKIKLKSDGVTAALYGASVSCHGKAPEDILLENANIELRASDTSNIVKQNYSGCNDQRFHWWNGEGKAYIEWAVTPLATGVYEIEAMAGYALESYSEKPYMEAYVDGNQVGEAQYPDDFTDSAPDKNKEVFGEVLLEEGKTYTLRLLLKGAGYNVYLKGMNVNFKRMPEAKDYWKDSVTVNGWEPTEKKVSSSAENYGAIISQSNHYATYTVAPGEGFFKLSITYGVNSASGNAPLTLDVNGKSFGTIMAPANSCYWPNAEKPACTLELGVIKLKDGENKITLGHDGTSTMYYSIGKVMLEAIETPVESLYSGAYVDSDKLITEVVNGKMTAYARLPRSLDGKTILSVFAVYEKKADGTTKLVDVASDSFVADVTGEVTLTVDGIDKNDASNYSYRLFYIESEGTFKPLF